VDAGRIRLHRLHPRSALTCFPGASLAGRWCRPGPLAHWCQRARASRVHPATGL